jgi:outer membrane receptor protein involved in Fe transport
MDVGGRTQNHAVSFGTGQYQSATRYPEPNERENQLFAAEIVADLGFAELTSATGFGHYEELGQRDQTDLLITLEYYYELFPAFSAFTREIQDDDFWSQELRLVSQGDGRLTWIGGLFYQSYESFGDSREFTPHYDEYLLPIGAGVLRPDSLEYIFQQYQDLEEKAVFGEIGIDITDRWQVTLGARYYDYTYETLSDSETPLLNTTYYGTLSPDETGLVLEPNAQADSGSLFKFNTSYRFSDAAMGYVTISEGYRFGASNGIAACDVPPDPNQNICALPYEEQFFPDSTTNYEIGLRSQWFDERLTFNAAVYYIDWQDPQLPTITVNGAQPMTTNGEGAESEGFEVSLDALVTDRFSVGFTFSHTTAELSDVAPDVLREFTPDCPTSCFGPGTLYDGLPAVYVDGLPGDRLPGSPEDQATFNIGYTIPFGTSMLDLDYHVASIGDVITKIGNRAGGETLGSYTVHSASASLSRGAWRVGLYAQNLTDEEAVTGVRQIRDFVQTVADENGDPVRVRSYAVEVLRPREIGLRFTYDLDL